MRPTEALKEEHRAIERALKAMEVAAEMLDLGQEVPRELLEKILEFVRGFADRCHHHKEEGVLFPYLERKGLPRDLGPIGVMLAEHEMGRGHVKAMAEAVEEARPRDFVAHARAYAALLRDHIAKEDNVLFPMADQMIGPVEAEELMGEFEEAEEELRGSH
ncbi:MAG: hemerythrin domain-containing protein, partial [Candidatus Thermoplasmatota archaeon]|nr:hemerythrin domain-containing protein [Candidatus Thermoplasmatota archaeon]